MTAHDVTFKDGFMASWPPMPWIVKAIVKFWFMGKHKSWWRFAPCDANGRPQKLPFA